LTTGLEDTPMPTTAAWPDGFTEISAADRTAATRKELIMIRFSSDHRTGSRLGRLAARAAVTVGAAVSFMFAWALQATAQTVPDFNPQQPTGGNELLKIGGMLKWVAIYGCSAAFFGGLCCLAGGRLLDHRGAHKIGIGLMFSSVGVAILVGSGVGLLNAFTSGN
jgi:hypothetical protein